MCNNADLDFVNINAYAKSGHNPSICSQDFERKQSADLLKDHNSVINLWKLGCNNPNSISMQIQNLAKFHQFILKILSGNEILTSIKGHNSVKDFGKLHVTIPT